MLVGVIVSSSQSAVGDLTIYRGGVVPNRDLLHYAILNNRTPPRGWEALGAPKTNVRIGVVHLAESVQQLSGWSLHDVYRGIDTLFLSLFLLGLFAYLRQWVPELFALLGVLFAGVVLPLTYLMHYFHPWDRVQLCLWLLILHTLRQRKPILLAGALCVSMLVKFDTLIVPLLYAMVHLTRENWRRVVPEAALLLAVAAGIYVGLDGALNVLASQERFDLESNFGRLYENLEDFNRLALSHPPLLTHGLLLLLAAVRLRTRERFLVAGVAFAGVMTALWYTFSVYAEVRPQTMLLLLLLPPALLTLHEELYGAPAFRPDNDTPRGL